MTTNNEGKKNIWTVLFVPLLLCSCMLFESNRTIKLILNPKNSGWYFVQLIQDSTIKDTGTVILRFDDTTRFLKVHVNDIQKSIVSPFDEKGKSLSPRLKFAGVKEIGNNKSFFEFYNPTNEELANIEKWNPTDQRADQIMSRGDIEFEKHLKNHLK